MATQMASVGHTDAATNSNASTIEELPMGGRGGERTLVPPASYANG